MKPVKFNLEGQDSLEMFGISVERKDELCDNIHAQMEKAGDSIQDVLTKALPASLNTCHSENERIMVAMNYGMHVKQLMELEEAENPLAAFFREIGRQ